MIYPKKATHHEWLFVAAMNFYKTVAIFMCGWYNKCNRILKGGGILQYIIFDLEWNCAFYGKDKHIHEIIEIGAVLLDENFNEIDRFSQFVRPTTTKKLNKYVKNLTHITDQDVNSAADFKTVLHEFEQFKRQPDTIYMTWSDTDLHVLSENCREFLKCESADFIEKYKEGAVKKLI